MYAKILLLVSLLGCGGAPLPLGECDDQEWPNPKFEIEVIEASNQVRATGTSCGGESQPAVSPLRASPVLTCVARRHARDMVKRGYFSHTSADGRSFVERIEQGGYAWASAAENIAKGQSSPEAVMQSWLQSSGHCKNIMSSGNTEIGVGFDERVWVMVLARPR